MLMLGKIRRLFSTANSTRSAPDLGDQAVVVEFKYRSSNLTRLFELEDKLTSAISKAGVGEFDGDDIGKDNCFLYMYGPDADRLFFVVRPILESAPLLKGATVKRRYGSRPKDVKEIIITI